MTLAECKKRLEMTIRCARHADSDYNVVEVKILEICKDALEKQMPIKTKIDTIFPSGVIWYACGRCGHNGLDKTEAYCHSCGQALEWEA